MLACFSNLTEAQSKVHLACQKNPTIEIKTGKSLPLAPNTLAQQSLLIKCSERRREREKEREESAIC